jgi:hypothetical protein
LRAVAPTAPDETIYNLGNEPLTYVLLKKPVPFYTNVYNESPIYAQQTTVQWLARYQPNYVFWDATADTFDGVPDQIRIPLVYSYVLQHYRFRVSDGRYQFLQRSDSADKPDFAYWIKMLGANLDLRYIPAASTLDHQSGHGTRNVDVVDLQVAGPRQGAQITVPVQFGEYATTLMFNEIAGKPNYIIRLDRIPILDTALSAGLSIRLGNPSSGVASLRRISAPPDDLY